MQSLSARSTTYADQETAVGLPVRKPADRRSSGCTTSRLPVIGQSGNDSKQGEGRLDLEFQVIMAVAPHVIDYLEQPEQFAWSSPSGIRRYTPDGLAHTTMGLVYFEVKPEKWLLRKPDLDGKLQDIIRLCEEREAAFAIVTERNIRAGYLLENSIRVWSASQDMDHGSILRSCAILGELRFPCHLQNVWQALGDNGRRIANGLIGHKHLAINLSAEMSGATVVGRGRKLWP